MSLADFKKEKFKSGRGTFCRETLTKTILFKGELGCFAIVSKVLDKDTLKVQTVRAFFREESMRRVVGLYLIHFADQNESIRI